MGNIQATANSHYSTMSNEDICNLKVGEIADDNSILFLWATFPKLQEALDVIKAWGFEYKTIGFNWIKKKSTLLEKLYFLCSLRKRSYGYLFVHQVYHKYLCILS